MLQKTIEILASIQSFKQFSLASGNLFPCFVRELET